MRHKTPPAARMPRSIVDPGKGAPSSPSPSVLLPPATLSIPDQMGNDAPAANDFKPDASGTACPDSSPAHDDLLPPAPCQGRQDPNVMQPTSETQTQLQLQQQEDELELEIRALPSSDNSDNPPIMQTPDAAVSPQAGETSSRLTVTPSHASGQPSLGPPEQDVKARASVAGISATAAPVSASAPDPKDHQQPQQLDKTPPPPRPRKMMFSEQKKTKSRSPLSKFRLPHWRTPDYDDLVSKDKGKQKDAVKRYLAEKIRSDWTFQWSPQQRTAPPRRFAVHASPAAGSTSSSLLSPLTRHVTSLKDVLSGNKPAPTQREDREDEGSSADSGEEADSETESVYSVMSDDPEHWRPRTEWTSDLSDNELDSRLTSPSPFRFDSPESVGAAVQASSTAGKKRRRRAVRDEMAWNNGLACFEARRDAWTGARTARVRPRTVRSPSPSTSPVSPASPRRGFFWRTHSRAESAGTNPASPTTPPQQAAAGLGVNVPLPLSPVTSNSHNAQMAEMQNTTPSTTISEADSKDGGRLSREQHRTHTLSPTTTATTNSCSSLSPSRETAETVATYPVETMLPIPPPLLPPANPMRASINPGLYMSIYDKVVVHNLQPSCPINLADMMPACVAGWKRDGEWPPRPIEPPAAAVVVVRTNKRDSKAGAQGSSGNAASSPHQRRDSAVSGRRLSLPFLSRLDLVKTTDEKGAAAADEDGRGSSGKGFKRSIQRVLGLGHSGHTPSSSIGSVKEAAA